MSHSAALRNPTDFDPASLHTVTIPRLWDRALPAGVSVVMGKLTGGAANEPETAQALLFDEGVWPPRAVQKWLRDQAIHIETLDVGILRLPTRHSAEDVERLPRTRRDVETV
jgi:hypothetical protein